NERREDIPDLSVHFLGKLYRTYRGDEEPPEKPPILSREAKDILMRHSYKGNIRELRSILLRALFFRRSHVITGDAISLAIAGTGSAERNANRPATRDLDERLANDIMARIAAGGDFWSEVYEPFSRNDISRETVRLVIEKSRGVAGKTMPAVARHLKALDQSGDRAEEQRMLFRFKNFLYKTVRIG
ncbi:MAG TPA: Fis family transcriptional regulator, partial [Desulfuromonadaceae bacterium]